MNTRDITIEAERSQKIAATVVDPELGHPGPAILFIHGWTGNRGKYVTLAQEIYAPLGFFCFAIDLRGHGESDGSVADISRRENLADVAAAYSYLSKLPEVDANKITVVGSSYGGYLAMLLSGVVQPAGLILRAPALYRDAEFKLSTARAIKRLGDYRRRHVDYWRNKALKSLAKFQGHALVIAGELDKDVPQQTIDNVVGALRSHTSYKIDVIPGADHRLSEERWQARCNTTMKTWIQHIPGVA